MVMMDDAVIDIMESGEQLDVLVCGFMESRPEAIAAFELRAKCRGDSKRTDYPWYLVDYAHSPGGWWRAQIGTNHNLDEFGNYHPERDLAPVKWEPARSPSENIQDAWEVAEKLRAFSVCRNKDGYWQAWAWSHTHLGSVATNAPLAICRTALKCANADGNLT
jgi:hypothetical protein